MPPYVTFHLGLHWLPKYLFTGFQNEKGIIFFPLHIKTINIFCVCVAVPWYRETTTVESRRKFKVLGTRGCIFNY